MTPRLNLIASEQPTTCPYDGHRTVWLGAGKDKDGEAYYIEHCPLCESIYHVYDEENDE